MRSILPIGCALALSAAGATADPPRAQFDVPSNRLSATVPVVLVQPVGGTDSTSVTIYNTTASAVDVAIGRGVEDERCGHVAAPAIPFLQCTMAGCVPVGGDPAWTLPPGGSREVKLNGLPQEAPGSCLQGFIVYDWTAKLMTAGFFIIQHTVVPAYYDGGSRFDGVAPGTPFDGYRGDGFTLRSDPAGSCAFLESSQYAVFPHIRSKAVVCWGAGLEIMFDRPANDFAFRFARPWAERGVHLEIDSPDWPGAMTSFSSERPAFGVAYSVILPAWVEGFFAYPVPPEGAYEGIDIGPVRSARVSLENGIPFIIDDLVIAAGASAAEPPLIHEVSPATALPRARVTVRGDRFLSIASNVSNLASERPIIPPVLRIGGAVAEIVSATDAEIVATVPVIGLGAAGVEVITADGRSSGLLEGRFFVGARPGPRRPPPTRD